MSQLDGNVQVTVGSTTFNININAPSECGPSYTQLQALLQTLASSAVLSGATVPTLNNPPAAVNQLYLDTATHQLYSFNGTTWATVA